MDMPLDKRWRKVAAGEQIGVSRFRLTFFLLVAAAGGLAISAVYFSLQQHADEGGRRDPGPYGWVLPAAMGAVLVAAVANILWTWHKDERLVLGRDRLQLLHFGRVVGEAPYANLAELTVQHRPKGEPLLLGRMADPKRADWFWPNPAGFHRFLQQSTGYDLMLTHEFGFADSAEVLRDKIQARLDAWRADPEGAP